MTPESVVTLAVSLVALVISIATATFAAVRFRFELRDRKRGAIESQPYFVLRGGTRTSGEGHFEPTVTLTNESTVIAIQILARSWDSAGKGEEENTTFMVRRDRLAPGESMDVTSLLIESPVKLAKYPEYWGNRWKRMHVEVGYRLPHRDESFVVAPLVDLQWFGWAIDQYLAGQHPLD